MVTFSVRDMFLQYDPELNANFWKLFPGFAQTTPYSNLYRTDRSKSKKSSSIVMWAILWANAPNCNSFYMSQAEKDEEIETNFFTRCKYEYKDELIQECFTHFKEKIIPIGLRDIYDYYEILEDRKKFLREQNYNLKNMDNLDKAYAATNTLLKSLKEKEAMFKESEQHTTYGDIEESASESGQI